MKAYIILIQYLLCMIPAVSWSQSVIAHYMRPGSTNFDEKISYVLVSNLSEGIFSHQRVEAELYQSEEKNEYDLPTKFELRFEREGTYIHKSLTTNSATEWIADFNGDYYQIDDPNLSIEWTLVDEQREILHAMCYKATTVFRGREYEVWYNPNVPIPNGPWKFLGLPGLIYSMEERTGLIGFEITSLEFRESDHIDITYPKLRLKGVMAPQEFNELYLDQLEAYLAFKEASLRKDGANIRIAINREQFQPIEVFDGSQR